MEYNNPKCMMITYLSDTQLGWCLARCSCHLKILASECSSQVSFYLPIQNQETPLLGPRHRLLGLAAATSSIIYGIVAPSPVIYGFDIPKANRVSRL